MISVYVVHYLFVLCGRRSALEPRELFYFGFQGNVKSAIPLAFILKFEDSITHKHEAITSMILIVVFTVLINGSLMTLLARLLLGVKERIHRGPKIKKSGEEAETGSQRKEEEESEKSEEFEEFHQENEMEGSEHDD